MSSRQSAQAAIAAMKAARDGKTSRVDQIEVRVVCFFASVRVKHVSARGARFQVTTDAVPETQTCAQIKNESLYDVVTEDEFVKRMMKNPDTMEFVVDDRDADQGAIS